MAWFNKSVHLHPCRAAAASLYLRRIERRAQTRNRHQAPVHALRRKIFRFSQKPDRLPKMRTVYEVASMPARSRTRGEALEEDEQELQAEEESVTAAVPEDDIEVEEAEAAEDIPPRRRGRAFRQGFDAEGRGG